MHGISEMGKVSETEMVTILLRSEVQRPKPCLRIFRPFFRGDLVYKVMKYTSSEVVTIMR